MIGDSNDETYFLHKLLLTGTQVSRLPKASANGLSANTKSSKAQPSKMVQLGEYLPFGLTTLLNSKKLLISIRKLIENSIPRSVKVSLKDSLKDSLKYSFDK